MRLLPLPLPLLSLVAFAPFASALNITGKFGPNTSDVDPIHPSGDIIAYKTPSVSTTPAAGVGSFITDASWDTNMRFDTATAGTPASITWTLDTEVSPTGYSLEEFRLFTKQDNALIFHAYDIEVRQVGSAGFTKLNTEEIVYPSTQRGVTLEDDFFGAGVNYAESIVSASSGTYFATGVAEFRITVYPVANGFGAVNPVFATLGNSYKGMQIVNVSLLATSTVPESSTTTLCLALAGLTFAYSYRRFRSKHTQNT